MLNSWSQLLFLFNTVFLVFLAKEEFRINKKLIVVSILVPATFVSPVAGIALLFLLEWFFVVPNFLKKENIMFL